MNDDLAKKLRELDNVVFEMYEKDILTLEQYDQILQQTINVRISVKNLSQHLVIGCFDDYKSIEKEATDFRDNQTRTLGSLLSKDYRTGYKEGVEHYLQKSNNR